LSYASSCYNATTMLFSLPLHDALPISGSTSIPKGGLARREGEAVAGGAGLARCPSRPHSVARPSPTSWRCAMSALLVGYARCSRSEEHTSELQSRENLVCRLPLVKKKH